MARPLAFIQRDGRDDPAPLTLDGTPVERITGAQVSPSYFSMLGAHPRSAEISPTPMRRTVAPTSHPQRRAVAAGDSEPIRTIVGTSDLDGRAIVYRDRRDAAGVRAAELRLDD